MIVNVNPYDTGYDENSHVMKFAALAREVYVTPAPAPIHRMPTGMKGPGKSSGTIIKELGPLTLKDPEIAPKPYHRKVTISMGPAGSKKAREAILEVLEGMLIGWILDDILLCPYSRGRTQRGTSRRR